MKVHKGTRVGMWEVERKSVREKDTHSHTQTDKHTGEVDTERRTFCNIKLHAGKSTLLNFSDHTRDGVGREFFSVSLFSTPIEATHYIPEVFVQLSSKLRNAVTDRD